MSGPVTLFCVIHGDPHGVPFPVKITREETVGELKKLIKREKANSLKHIDADQLSLFEANVLAAEVGDVPLEDMFDTMDTVEEVFQHDLPKPKCVHIIVKVPGK